MALIIKTVGENFTNPGIPLLQRDRVADSGTLEVLDALDSVSFPLQANPPPGFNWTSLYSDEKAEFFGSVEFADGLVLNGGSDKINLPSGFEFAPGESRLAILWLKPLSPQSATSHHMFGWSSGGYANGVYQIGIQSGNSAVMVSNMIPGQLISSQSLVAGEIVQLAIACEYTTGGYVFKAFKNGVKVATVTTSTTTFTDPGVAPSVGGNLFGGNLLNAAVYRAVANDLSERTAEEIVQLDYQTYRTRFEKDYTVEYLVVGGGGGGGAAQGGNLTAYAQGGGGGGEKHGTSIVDSMSAYPIVVGAGGAGGQTQNPLNAAGTSGGSSVFNAVTATGGGAGGTSAYARGGSSGADASNLGGTSSSTASWGQGGGGGAGTAGGNGTTTAGGNGGNGYQWSNGTYYGGGGGGGIYRNAGTETPGTGGLGGGGNAPTGNGVGAAGTNGLGGGGSGAGAQGGAGNANYAGGAGGSGVVVLRYQGAQRGSGGTVTQSGGYTYHTFTTSGTFTA